MIESLKIPKIFDAHVHLREGDMLKHTVPAAARICQHAMVMPNLKVAITSPLLMREYKQQIKFNAAPKSELTPHMTFELRENTPVAMIEDFIENGAMAAKVYPYKLTTNSHHGVQHYQALYPALAEMQAHDLVLCLHGEQPGLPLDGTQWLQAEQVFIDKTLVPIARNFPGLRIVLEHISTAYAVQVVKRLVNVYATITAHHLVLNHDDVGGYRMCPNNFCKPVAKTENDRLALVEAATEGNPKFFYGSDSAPHPRDGKERALDCCAGCYTMPMALPLLAVVFERAGALLQLEDFTRTSAMRFYNLEDDGAPELELVRRKWQVPLDVDGVIPFMAGSQLAWQLADDV